MKFKMNSNTRILYVDDDKEDIGVIIENLEKIGFPNVRVAENGDIVVELIQRFQPHLILLATMKDGSGYNICKKIKQVDYGKKIPVIGVFDGAYKKDWENAGAYYSLPKYSLSIKEQGLVDIIKGALRDFKSNEFGSQIS